MNDEELKVMSKADANKLLNPCDKLRWCNIHNSTANLYFFDVSDYLIKDVEPSGWWY